MSPSPPLRRSIQPAVVVSYIEIVDGCSTRGLSEYRYPLAFSFPVQKSARFSSRKFHLDSKHPRFLASSLFQISTGVDGGVSTPENNFVGTKFAPPRLLYTVGKGSQLIDTLLPTNATNDSCSRTVISNRAWLGFTGSVFVNQFD